MARLQNFDIWGVLFLTLTVLLNTPPTEAGNCPHYDVCNGGTCPDPNNAPYDCSGTGFFGDICVENDCVATSVCMNGGVCTGVTPCDCSGSGYTGDLCEDACDDNGDCQNGGTCETGVGTCMCDTGYTGDFCQNACDDNSDCQNGGTCEIGVGMCQCDTGYQGDFCQNAPECHDDVDCGTGGTCVKTPVPYTCTCAEGYTQGNDHTCAKNGSSPIQVSLMFLLMSLIVSVL